MNNLSTNVKLQGITGVILTLNGERLLDKCLSSLSFCDEILVVDSGSLDQTKEIAFKHKATFVYNKWEGFAKQFLFAQKLVKTRWFFIVDQDEICSKELGNYILSETSKYDQSAIKLQEELLVRGEDISSKKSLEVVAFSVNRRSWYYDRFMKHSGWYPDYVPRVFCTGYVDFYQDAHIHYDYKGVLVKLSKLNAELIHYPYTSFFHQLDKLNTYAEQGAEFYLSSGKKGSLSSAIGHGIWRFIRIYFLKLGFLDGKAGFIAAVHGSFYAFSKYIRVLQSSWGAPFDDK